MTQSDIDAELDRIEASLIAAQERDRRERKNPLVGGGQGRPGYDPGCEDESDSGMTPLGVVTLVIVLAGFFAIACWAAANCR